MRLLVDTHAFLWLMNADRRLSDGARRAIDDAPGEWCVSAASVWEVAIKSSQGNLTLPAPVPDYIAGSLQDGVQILSVDWQHAAAVERLPFHHKDPFDRLLVAQAQTEGLAVVTHDAIFREYGVRVVW